MRPSVRAFALGLVLLATTACAGAIVELPVEGPLDSSQIKAALQGDDFRVKAHARDELKKQPEAQRLAILEEVLTTADAQTRLLIVSELADLSPELGGPLLKSLAANDPDPEVKEFAAMVLEEAAAKPEAPTTP